MGQIQFAGILNDIAGAVENEQLQSRDMRKEFDHPELGAVRVTDSGIKLGNTSAHVHGLPPDLGEHTRQILHDVAGVSEAEVARLFDESVYEHERVVERGRAGPDGSERDERSSASAGSLEG